MLKEHRIDIGVDGKVRWLDSMCVERLRASLKYEAMYPKVSSSIRKTDRVISAYFDFYNRIHPHQSLDRLMPAEGSLGAQLMKDVA